MEALSKFCCVCVEAFEHLTSVLETDLKDVKLCDKLKLCEPSQVWYQDFFFICNLCEEYLNIAYDFVLKCQKSESLRLERLQEIENQKHIKLEESREIENVEHIKLEESPEVICDMCKKSFKHKKYLKQHITLVHIAKRNRRKIKIEKVVKKMETDEVINKHIDDIIEKNKNCDSNDTDNEYNETNYVDDDTKHDFKENFNDTLADNTQGNNHMEEEEYKHKKIKKQKVIRKKRQKGPHTCEFCGRVFNRRQHWSAHVRANHTFEKIYKCEIENCGASFINSHSLLVHKRNHKNEKPYICSACGKCFVCSGDLYHHSKIHENKREYKCDICQKGFNTTSILRTHKIVKHTDPAQWRYVCPICERRFPINSGLVTHTKRHTGQKNFACILCDKKFFNKPEVTKHLLSHSSERLFKCTNCEEKTYKNQEGLRKHQKLVHGLGNWKPSRTDKKFYCPMCTKVFNMKNKLQRHMFTHTGEKPFDCHLCQKKFVDKYQKKVHMRKEHKIELEEKTFVIPSTGTSLFIAL